MNSDVQGVQFFGMDNYRIGDVKLDIDNLTLDDLKRFASLQWAIQFRVAAGADEKYGPLRCY
jgi:hypothetical protein